jgi:hypothetical protein
MTARAILFRDVDPINTGVGNVPVGSILVRTTAGLPELYTKIGSGSTGLSNWALVGSGLISPLRAVAGQNTDLRNITATEEVLASFTIPANSLAVGAVFRYRVTALLTGNNAATPTLRIRVGPTTLTGIQLIAFTGPPGNDPAAGTTSHVAEGQAFLQTAPGTFRTDGVWHKSEVVGGGPNYMDEATNLQAIASATVDNLFELTLESGNAANSYQIRSALVERIR